MRGRSADVRLAELLREAQRETAMLREHLLRIDTVHRHLVRLLEIERGVTVDQIARAALDAAAALVPVDAALLLIRVDDGEPFAQSYGLHSLDEQRVKALVAAGPVDDPYRMELAELDDGGAESGVGFEVGYAMPIATAGGGTLAVLWRQAPADLEQRLEVLAEIALTLAVAVANERILEEVRDMAARDPLTALYNRRIFHEELARATSTAARYGERLALCVLDVDEFKRVNTILGHLDGDAILVEVARCVSGGVRAGDVAGRIGGDEFAVLMPHSAVADAAQLYERVTRSVAAATRSRGITIAISAGVGQFSGSEDGPTFFRRVELAMRAAKQAGKARYVVAGAEGAFSTGA